MNTDPERITLTITLHPNDLKQLDKACQRVGMKREDFCVLSTHLEGARVLNGEGLATLARPFGFAAALPAALMLMGPAVNRFQSHEVQVPGDTLMVHGEEDEVVPLSEAMDWARPRSIPVVVVPGASHFFHGKLLVLRQLVQARLKVALD